MSDGRTHYFIGAHYDKEGEASFLAARMAQEYKHLIKRAKHTGDEIRRRFPDDPVLERYTENAIQNEVDAPACDGAVKMIMQAGAWDVTWHDLTDFFNRSPDEAWKLWEAVKSAAKTKINAGHYFLEVAQLDGTPFEAAIFGTIREAFYDDWKPRGAIESMMVEMLVQSFFNWQRWLEASNRMLATEENAQIEAPDMYYGKKWQPQRLTSAAAQDRAFEMAEKNNRIFLRTLRQMRDLRRYNVVINNVGGQVNVATDGGKQVNAMVEGPKISE